MSSNASSQLLSASMSSSTSSRHGSSQISKIYRQASTLFLTRRLPESLSTILPVITAPRDLELNGHAPGHEKAPIAAGSRTTRIKVWSLYLTILNAIVELEPEEGKQAFGTQEWRALVTKVRDGIVWEEVVQNGYGGIEGDVDADVVINLATLLLAHARTQHLNQQRLENYLVASTNPNLDITSRLAASQSPNRHRNPSPNKRSGTDTPRDLNARIKILELYTLHVLLRNDEWEYAREFINNSPILDEERRDAFLAALQSLEDEKAEAEAREAEIEREHEEKLREDLEEARERRIEEEERERQRLEERRENQRAASEVDYGIESTPTTPRATGSANGSVKGNGKSPKTAPKAVPAKKGKTTNAPLSKPASGKKVAVQPPTLLNRASIIFGNIRKLLEAMALSFKLNPMILLRTLAFIFALILALSRRDVKERLRTVWEKVRKTAGMGVKVSYI